MSLITDFGLEDPYVGIMKGVILALRPEVRVVDLTHGIPPQDVRRAAWLLRESFRFFPLGTVHVAVIDPGVGSPRDVLCVEAEGHLFVGPDNGVFGPLLECAGSSARRVEVERLCGEPPSRTFHGRDVFAPLGARLATDLSPADCGPSTRSAQGIDLPRWRRGEGGELRGEILFEDRFGNLLTNLPASEVPGGGLLSAGAFELPIRGTYAEVESGKALALVNSYGFLELAVNGGHAARQLGLTPGAEVVVPPSSRA